MRPGDFRKTRHSGAPVFLQRSAGKMKRDRYSIPENVPDSGLSGIRNGKKNQVDFIRQDHRAGSENSEVFYPKHDYTYSQKNLHAWGT